MSNSIQEGFGMHVTPGMVISTGIYENKLIIFSGNNSGLHLLEEISGVRGSIPCYMS